MIVWKYYHLIQNKISILVIMEHLEALITKEAWVIEHERILVGHFHRVFLAADVALATSFLWFVDDDGVLRQLLWIL